MYVTFGSRVKTPCKKPEDKIFIHPKHTYFVNFTVLDPPNIFSICIVNKTHPYAEKVHLLDVNSTSFPGCDQKKICVVRYDRNLNKKDEYIAYLLAQPFFITYPYITKVGFSIENFADKYSMKIIDKVHIDLENTDC